MRKNRLGFYMRTDGEQPRFHGNGFIQLYLSDRARLHIWTPSLPPLRSHNATIHTHRYDMESKVICGLLKHTTYDVEQVTQAWRKPTCQIIQLTGASDPTGRKKPGEVLAGRCLHTVRHEYVMGAGSHYTFKQNLFHSSDNGYDGTTATVFKKTSSNSPEFAKILLVGGEAQPTHAFDPATQPEQEAMWSVIEKLVKIYHAEIDRAIKN